MASEEDIGNADIHRTVWLKRCSNYASLLPLILYLPIGLLLGIVRFFIFLHACLVWFVLPDRFPLKRLILRVMLTVTGLPITIQGMPAMDNRKKIFIANHVSNLDPFILALLNPNVLALDATSSGISWSKGRLRTYEMPADKDYSDVVKSVKDKMNNSEEPLLFFPERMKTNGKTSILKFNSLPFEMDCPIQPVTIQAYRYLFDIHVSTHSSTIYQDIAWCFLTPMTLFKVKYLPLTEQKKDESKEEFSLRVQGNMAKSLGVTPSNFTHHDVIEYLKNTVERASTVVVPPKVSDAALPSARPKQPARETVTTAHDEELRTMLKQVQDVLPDTPSYCILADLRKTRDVDITITNILEGRVEVKQEPVESEKVPPMSQGLSFKASKFESDARNRQLSFAERKQAMLEAARLKYKLKHGL